MDDVGPITFGTTSKRCHATLAEKPHVSTSLRWIDRAFSVRMRFESLHVAIRFAVSVSVCRIRVRVRTHRITPMRLHYNHFLPEAACRIRMPHPYLWNPSFTREKVYRVRHNGLQQKGRQQRATRRRIRNLGLWATRIFVPPRRQNRSIRHPTGNKYQWASGIILCTPSSPVHMTFTFMAKITCQNRLF